WKKPRRIFINSMSDLFHEDVPFEFIDKIFAVMGLTPQHTFQILTKRPQRMLEYLKDGPRPMWSYWMAHFLLRDGTPNTAEKIGRGFDRQTGIQAGQNFLPCSAFRREAENAPSSNSTSDEDR